MGETLKDTGAPLEAYFLNTTDTESSTGIRLFLLGYWRMCLAIIPPPAIQDFSQFWSFYWIFTILFFFFLPSILALKESIMLMTPVPRHHAVEQTWRIKGNYFKANTHANTLGEGKEALGISHWFLACNFPNSLAVNWTGHGTTYNWRFVDNRVVF